MKMNPFSIILSACFIVIVSSCSPRLSPLTEDLVNQNRWTEDELRKIQFYLSDNIILRREIASGSSQIVRGEIKMVDGKKVEEINIPKGTPGVFVFSPKQDRLAVSFEAGGDQRFLMFGPNPKSNDRFVLLASDWNRNRGKVTYDGEKYYTPSSSAHATLMVDLKRVKKISVKSRTAKGRKIN